MDFGLPSSSIMIKIGSDVLKLEVASRGGQEAVADIHINRSKCTVMKHETRLTNLQSIQEFRLSRSPRSKINTPPFHYARQPS